MRIISLILCGLVITVTALPLINSPQWWIRIFDFPRVQIAVLTLVALVLAAVFVDFAWKFKAILLLAVAAALAYQVQMVVVYTSLYPTQARDSQNPDADNSFSILVTNVRMENEDKEPFHAMVHRLNPDVLLINEPDHEWAASIAKLDGDYPHAIKYPLDNTYGMMLLSKLPLRDGAVNFLVEDNIPSIFAKIILPSGAAIDFYGVHPEPPKPGTDTYERDTELLIIGKKIKETDNPTVVAGDLNDVGWSGTSKLFRSYSGLVDPREGRGLFNTYSVKYPLLRYPLDHVFYSEEFGLISLEKLEDIGSDHFPMLIKLNYAPSTHETDHLEKTNAKENEEVRESIESGKKKSSSDED